MVDGAVGVGVFAVDVEVVDLVDVDGAKMLSDSRVEMKILHWTPLHH